MAKLVKELELSSTFTKTIYLAKSKDFENPMDSREWNTIYAQGFVWYRNFVAFEGITDIGNYWVKILSSTSLDLEPKIERAIVVPFEVPSSKELYLYDEVEAKLVPFPMEQGYYQLLFQTRFLTQEEIVDIPKFAEIYLPLTRTSTAPQLVQLTFVPAQGMTKPEILIPKRGGIRSDLPYDNLVLFDEEKLRSEEDY